MKVQVCFCIAFLMLLTGCSETGRSSTGVKWEYEFDSLRYDVECSTKAFKSFESNKSIADAVHALSTKERELGSLGVADISVLNLMSARSGYITGTDEITEAYRVCMRETFVNHLPKMGNDGWEMVSYKLLESDGYLIGHEIMWKRIQ